MSTLVMFKQGDPTWANELLGHNTDKNFTLAKQGCLVTSFASFISTVGQSIINPRILNHNLKLSNGFVPDGGILIWQAIPRLFSWIVFVRVESSLAKVNEWLEDEPNHAIIKLNNGAHYAWAPLVGKMVDPADGKLKDIPSSYKFTEARLYRVIGGKGAGAILSTSTTESDVYTNPDNGDKRDARGWYNAYDERNRQWHVSEREKGVLVQENTGLKARVKELEAQAQTGPMSTALLEASEVPRTATRVAKTAGKQVGYNGEQPDYDVTPGMVFHQYSTFVADGQVLVRTQKSKDAGLWYGTPDDLFDPLPAPDPSELSADQRIHLSAAMLLGPLMKFLHNFKKGK